MNDTAYTNNPKFLTVVNEYGFHAIPDFSKQSIADRAETYLRMASDIWNPDAIKEIAGGWADDDEKRTSSRTRRAVNLQSAMQKEAGQTR